MKPRLANHRITALTLTEVLVVIAALVLLVAILLPVLAASKRKSSRLGCVSQLRQIGISFRMWSDDNFDKLPMQVSVMNEGAMESIITGNVAVCFSVLSNTLSNPATLICPQDAKHFPATNFDTLYNSNISYFIGLNAVVGSPQAFLSGDDNLMMNSKEVLSGILSLQNGDALAWTKERHRSGWKGVGNILLDDGSVQQTSSADLTSTARLATNRLAIP